MNPTSGRGHHLALLFVALAVVALFVVGGAGASPAATDPVGSVVSSSPAPSITAISIDENWVISNLVTYSDTTIEVAGSITVESGGTLSLQNDIVQITEPSALDRGLVVDSGGSLVTNGTTFESTSSVAPIWMQADAGAHVSIGGGSILDLGGSGGHPGFVIDASGATLIGVVFNTYYEALSVSATDVTVRNCYFGNTTSSSESTFVISTSGTSAGFAMTHSKVVDTSMIGGALSVESSSDIENSTFTLDPKGTNPTPILMGYSGSDGFINASGSKFAYNMVSGSDVVDFDSSDVTIIHNQIVNTGGAQYVHDYGVRAETVNPSGRGVWVNGLTIENNFISDATSYGIRVEQNITNVVIAYNNITNASTTPEAGSYNGLSTYVGIYLIRGVTHGLVYDNHIDNSADQEHSNLGTAGIGLESEVDYTTVSDNTVLNTDLGIWVQGDWNDGPGNVGPSLHNTVTGNTIENTLAIVETPLLASAIQNYDWANYTTISDNYIVGWDKVPSGDSSYEGEAIHQADLYGTIDGNVIASATVGIVFGYFYGNGVSNGSYNVAYDNTIDVTGSAIVYDTTDSHGAIVEDLNELTSSTTKGGFPTMTLQSIGETDGLTFAEAGGSYSVTLETQNPATGVLGNFTSYIPLTLSDFSAQVSGNLGVGKLSPSVTSVTPTEVNYSIASTGLLHHVVSLDVPAELYSANYSVSQAVGTADKETFAVSSSTGPASFQTDVSGTLSISVTLLNWRAANVTLGVNVTLANGTAVPGLTTQVDLNQTSSSTFVWVGPTNATGGAAYYGLPYGTSVTNVSLEGTGYVVTGYSVSNPGPRLILLNVTVAVETSPVTSTYPISFVEENLAAGTSWWVSLVGPVTMNITSTASQIQFNLTAGSYEYSFGSLYATVSGSNSGAFGVPGSSPLIMANFTAVNPSTGVPPAQGTAGTGGLSLGLLVALPALVAGVAIALLMLRQRKTRGPPRPGKRMWNRIRLGVVSRGSPPPEFPPR